MGTHGEMSSPPVYRTEAGITCGSWNHLFHSNGKSSSSAPTPEIGELSEDFFGSSLSLLCALLQKEGLVSCSFEL